ncbi:hypothetical protein GC177_00805 [bacterium]|nr:hypothetical protein [bacterium]
MRHIETPTQETLNKGVYCMETPAEGSPRLRRQNGSMLDLLLLKNMLTSAEHKAGSRFARDFSIGSVGRVATASWKERTGKSAISMDMTTRQVQSRMSFNRAWNSLAPSLRDIAWRICCFDEGLEQVEKSLNLPRRSAKVLLAAALDQLNLHYSRPQKPH